MLIELKDLIASKGAFSLAQLNWAIALNRCYPIGGQCALVVRGIAS